MGKNMSGYETWNSVDLCRLLQRVFHDLPVMSKDDDDPATSSFPSVTRADFKRMLVRLERHCTEHACPTCGSSFYSFEESSEP